MADRYATKSGNWSDVTVWDGGVSLPGIGDVVRPNGFTVTIDQDIEVATLSTYASAPALAGGSFHVTNIPIEGRYMTCSLYAGSGNVVVVTAPSGVVSITGYVEGGRLGSMLGISVASESSVVVTGDIRGGVSSASSGGSPAIGISGGAEVTINGNIMPALSSWSPGVRIDNALAIVNVNGIVNSGSSSTNASAITGVPTQINIIGSIVGSYCVKVNSAASVNISGTITSIGGTPVNITNSNAILDIDGEVAASNEGYGIQASGLSNRFTGPLIDAPNGRKAIYAPGWLLKYGTQIQETIMDDNFYTPGSQVVLSNYVSDSPPPSDVRAGKVYGTGSALIGTLEMPTAEQTMTGIPVDDTVGTAALSIVDIAAVTGAQIAKAVGNG